MAYISIEIGYDCALGWMQLQYILPNTRTSPLIPHEVFIWNESCEDEETLHEFQIFPSFKCMREIRNE